MCLSLTPPNPMADSDSAYSAIKKDARILVVGAGRIGCEVLKTLVLSGCQDIYIIDKDFIEVDDLDGQFLFRPSHVGKTKAGVARRAVLNFRPDITINSCHGNVKDPEFDVNFFKQFNVVVNGVDNFDVWRHVNRLCLAADVPLIGSWTTGFLGQVTVHVKEVTECYECQPKPAPETYPVCTISSIPSEFVHCIIWAKEILFTKLLADKSQASLRSSDVFNRREDENIEQFGRRIYDHVFGHNIEVALSNEELWKNRCKPEPFYSKDVLPNDVSQQNKDIGTNDATSDPLSVPAIESLGLQNPQAALSLTENSRVFLEALKRILMEREKVTLISFRGS